MFHSLYYAIALFIFMNASLCVQGGGPEIASPIVHEDKSITFNVQAPNSKTVLLFSSDLPDIGRGLEIKKTNKVSGQSKPHGQHPEPTGIIFETSKKTVEMLKPNGFEVTFKESEGGHSWLNWRDYLHEFAPLLFKN